MEELRELLKHTSDEKSKNKILEMVQTWGMAFRNSPKYRIVTVSFACLVKSRLGESSVAFFSKEAIAKKC